MPVDDNLQLMYGDDGAGGNIDDTVTGSWVSVKGGADLDVIIALPSAVTGTSPTMDVAIQLSTDGSNNDWGRLDFEQLTKTTGPNGDGKGVWKKRLKIAIRVRMDSKQT